jgi:hypothetical protein
MRCSPLAGFVVLKLVQVALASATVTKTTSVPMSC